jgi:deoxycytidylate deaminase
VAAFKSYFEQANYNVLEIKVTDVFKLLEPYLPPKTALVQRPLNERYDTHIAYGNQIREFFEDDSTLSALTIGRLIRRRLQKGAPVDQAFTKNVYLIHQFKRKEEIDLLRSVYGRLFFQISVYSRRGARVDYLSRKFAQDANSANANAFRSQAEAIIDKDENQSGEDHGQRVAKIFHDGDLIINTDVIAASVPQQVERFCDLIMGSNQISPTKLEYGLFIARAAALRTLDLSRQVGAAIFTDRGEIISMGSNEVPKAGGGTYWCDDPYDDREFKRRVDSNDKRKFELLRELVSLVVKDGNPESILKDTKVLDSQFMDALEYGRIIHAEMSAICDAARLGKSLQDSVMFCTTFPLPHVRKAHNSGGNKKADIFGALSKKPCGGVARGCNRHRGF